ncbi:hypothetical protein TNCV_4086011 [Trichonephila clavipes]|nr:hypothetical protein TNCV_4086011 [Trichonephila clavipes]
MVKCPGTPCPNYHTNEDVIRSPVQVQPRGKNVRKERSLALSGRRQRHCCPRERGSSLSTVPGERISRHTIYRRLGHARRSTICRLPHKGVHRSWCLKHQQP